MGRGVLIVSIRLGIDPYGFIGKFQAVSGYGKAHGDLSRELFELFFGNPTTKGRITECLVTRFEKAVNFNHANTLIKYLEKMESATPQIVERLAKASSNNTQVAGAFDVQERLPLLLEKLKGGR